MAEQSAAMKIAEAFVHDCIRNGIPLSGAWMFGSQVSGHAHEYSDIDLALVSDVFTLNFLENNHKTALLNYKYPDVELHHFNSNTFRADDPFINEIKRTGIKIYEA